MSAKFEVTQLMIELYNNMINSLGVDAGTVVAALPGIVKKLTVSQAIFLINASYANRTAIEIKSKGQAVKIDEALQGLPITIRNRTDLDDNYNFRLMRMVGSCLVYLLYVIDSTNEISKKIYAKHPSPFDPTSVYTASSQEILDLKNQLKTVLVPVAAQVVTVAANAEVKSKMVTLQKEYIEIKQKAEAQMLL